MEWKTLSKVDAKQKVIKWEKEGLKAFKQMIADLDTSAGNLNQNYRSLRTELLLAWEQAQQEVEEFREEKKRKTYLIDLIFGSKLYQIMKKRGMNVRFASYDNIWIYIGMTIVPEITFERFGDKNKSKDFTIPADHYYLKSVRIYLKSLWWYIFLSMRFDDRGREDLSMTVKMLWDQNTDTLFQFVERTGREGYRVEVYRALIRYLCEHPEVTAKEFRSVMILNTAKTQIVEPYLYEGGYDEYVKELYCYIRDKETT